MCDHGRLCTLDNDGIISIERKCEIWGLVMLLLTIFLLLSLATDGFQADPESGRPIDGMLSVPNRLGPPGAFVAGLLAFLIGDASHVLYALTGIWALKLLIHRPIGRPATRIVGLVLLTGALAGTLHICMDQGFTNTQPGGAFGAFVAENFLVKNFGNIGSSIIALTAALIGTLLATDFLFIQLLVYVQRFILWLIRGVWFALRGMWRMACWLVGSGEAEEPQETATPEPAATTEPAFALADAAPVMEPPVEGPHVGWASRVFASLKPTIKHKYEEETDTDADIPEQEEEQADAAPNIIVVGDTFKEALPAEGTTGRALKQRSFHRETATPDPFGPVPGLDEEEQAVDDLVASERSPENDLFAISEDPEYVEDKQQEEEKEEPLDIEAVLAPPKKERPTPRLRRKNRCCGRCAPGRLRISRCIQSSVSGYVQKRGTQNYPQPAGKVGGNCNESRRDAAHIQSGSPRDRCYARPDNHAV